MKGLQACGLAALSAGLLWASAERPMLGYASAQAEPQEAAVTCGPVERDLRYEPASDLLLGSALGLSDGVGTTAAQRSRATATAHRRARALVHEALDAQLSRRNASPALAARLHSVVDHWRGPHTVRDLGDGSVVACVAYPVSELRRACGEGSEWLWER